MQLAHDMEACSVCGFAAVSAPKGWDPTCTTHFSSEYTKDEIIEQFKCPSPFYTEEELNYLALMGVDVIGALSEIIHTMLHDRTRGKSTLLREGLVRIAKSRSLIESEILQDS